MDGWQVAHPVLNEGKMAGTHANKEGPQWVSFSGPGIPLIWSSDSGFESKIDASLGIESMFGRWDSKNNPRDTRLHDDAEPRDHSLLCRTYAAFEIFLTEGSKFFGVWQNGK